MADNTYDTGRLNLPFVGSCTFGKYPYPPDRDAIDADTAGVGTTQRSGTPLRAFGG